MIHKEKILSINNSKRSSNEIKEMENEIEDEEEKYQKSKLINIRYEYCAIGNKFTTNDQILMESLNTNQIQQVEKWIHYMIKKSNIKKTSTLLLCFWFFLIIAVGFSLVYLSVTLKWGLFPEGMFSIVTPLAAFFLVFGYSMVRGDQIERFEKWWKKEKSHKENEVVYNGLSLNCEMKKVGLKVMYSFSKG